MKCTRIDFVLCYVLKSSGIIINKIHILQFRFDGKNDPPKYDSYGSSGSKKPSDSRFDRFSDSKDAKLDPYDRFDKKPDPPSISSRSKYDRFDIDLDTGKKSFDDKLSSSKFDSKYDPYDLDKG